jgi:UDP-glucose 4-epimerase
LLTAGAGYICGHTVLALLDRGEAPVVLNDLSTGNRTAVSAGVPFNFNVAGADSAGRLGQSTPRAH